MNLSPTGELSGSLLGGSSFAVRFGQVHNLGTYHTAHRCVERKGVLEMLRKRRLTVSIMMSLWNEMENEELK